MSVRIRTSFVWLWMAALLSATVGMSVRQVYCYCTGKTQVSFFSLQASALEKKLTRALNECCAKKEHQSKPACCPQTALKNQGCTKKSTQYVQLKTELDIQGLDYKKLDGGKQDVLLPDFLLLHFPVEASEHSEILGIESLPPPLSGRMICVRHGLFLC